MPKKSEDVIEVKEEKLLDPIAVRPICQTGGTVLVEWETEGDFKRGYIAKNLISQGFVDAGILEMAAPYGIEFEKLEIKNLSAEEFAASLARELRKNGIWTWEDIGQKVTTVQACINQVNGVTLAALLTQAGEHMK